MARECALCVHGTGFCTCSQPCASPRCTAPRTVPGPDFAETAARLRKLLFGPSPEELQARLTATMESARQIDGPASVLARALVEVLGVSRALAMRAAADPDAALTCAEAHTMLLDAVERGLRP